MRERGQINCCGNITTRLKSPKIVGERICKDLPGEGTNGPHPIFMTHET
jgi:hypothetical protein